MLTRVKKKLVLRTYAMETTSQQHAHTHSNSNDSNNHD